MAGNKTVFKNSFLYTIGNLLLKAFSFFLIPLYTAYLSTEEYGIINLASGFYTLASTIITLGLQYAIIRYYVDYKEDHRKVARMNGTVILFVSLCGVVFFALLYVFKFYTSKFFFSGIEFFPVVFLSVLISVTSGLYTVYQDILKGMQDARKSVGLSYLFFFCLLIGNVFTVTVLKMKANGILLSTLIVYIIMMIVMIIDLRHRKLIAFIIDKEILKEMMHYSLPLVPHTIAYNLQNYATRAIISAELSLSMLGIYGLAAQFGNISDVIVNSVQSAFQPWMFGLMNERKGKSKKEIEKVIMILLWLYGLVFLVIGVFSQEAVLIMANEKYADAWYYVPVIVAVFSIKAPLYFYLNYLYYEKDKTKYIFISTVIASIVNIVLTLAFVPSMGVMGSIFADLIAMLLRTVLTLYYARDILKGELSIVRIELLSLIPVVFIGLGSILSVTKYTNNLSIINIAYKLFIIFIYVIIFAVVNKNQLHKIIEIGLFNRHRNNKEKEMEKP